MRMNLLVDLLIYDNASATNDPADAIKIKKRVEEESVTEVSRHFPRIIADAVTDEVVVLPDANTDYLLMFTDQELNIMKTVLTDKLDDWIEPGVPQLLAKDIAYLRLEKFDSKHVDAALLIQTALRKIIEEIILRQAT